MAVNVFISQPMNGKTNEEINEVRTNAMKEIKSILGEDEDVRILEPLDPVLKTKPVSEKDHLWCLGKSLQTMAIADHVYFADGWKNKRGCVIEHQCAQLYGLNIIKE